MDKLKNFLSQQWQWFKLHQKAAIIIFLLADAAVFFVDLVLGASQFWRLVVGFAVTFIGMHLIERRERYLNELRSRIANDEGEPWTVSMHGVAVSQISDSAYAEITLSLLRDPTIYIKQVMNLSVIAHHMIISFVRQIPMATFWIVVYTLIWEPQVLQQFIAEWQRQASLGKFTGAQAFSGNSSPFS